MSIQQRDQLERWVRARTTPQRVALRAQICLLAADGLSSADIARRTNTSRPTVLLWKKRFQEQGPEGLIRDASRGPSPRRLDETIRQAIVDATANAQGPYESPWTTRTLAKALGVSNATVARVWKAVGIAPKKKKKDKRSRKKPVLGRFSELVGVYVCPPVKALVVSVCTAPAELPWSKSVSRLAGRNELEARGLVRGEDGCGSCLSAALRLIGPLAAGYPDARWSLQGLSQFLERLERQTPRNTELHVLLEETDSNIRSTVEQWAGSLEHTGVHVIPCGSFAESDITEAIVRSTGTQPLPSESHGIPSLVAAIDEFVRDEGGPKPFVWIREPASVHRGTEKCKAILETIRYVGTLIANVAQSHAGRAQPIHGQEEEMMNWKQKLESWFAAVAFAEEGEHATAIDVASRPIPEVRAEIGILSSLTTSFAAAAFAEENCHKEAAEILYGVRRTDSFLETAGLAHVRVWYGTASVEETFFEVVGLLGVRWKLMTVQL